jgi:hypothetical protein
MAPPVLGEITTTLMEVPEMALDLFTMFRCIQNYPNLNLNINCINEEYSTDGRFPLGDTHHRAPPLYPMQGPTTIPNALFILVMSHVWVRAVE